MTLILDGKIVADKILEDLKIETQELISSNQIPPGLALLIVGNNPASETYVASKDKTCKSLNYHSIITRLEDDVEESSIINLINQWNQDPQIHGILVQLPLPNHINENNVIMSINPDKDVDGFHPVNVGRLMIGIDGLLPCTPAGIVEMLKFYNIETKGKHVVVLGRSNIVGKPIANLMYQKHIANSVVTICHTASPDIAYYTKQADILIAAVGVANLIKKEDIKENCVIVDVGINRIEDNTSTKGYKIVGDVDYNDVFEKASAITPVPGGVGRMTIAMLMKNTMKARNLSLK